MKRVHTLFTKIVGLLIVFLVIIPAAFAQRPEIKEISKVKGSVGETVHLKGSFFGNDATKLVVFFGAAPATIVHASDQQLTVKVPSGTTYQDISVTRFNGLAGLTGYYRQPFFLSFGGAPGIDPNNFSSQANFPGAASFQGLYDLCMCDFDGDGKPDVAAARNGLPSLLVMLNTSTPGVVSLGSLTNVTLGTGSLQVKCGDLNGDGKPDIVATEKGTGDNVFFLRNTSVGPGSLSFARTQMSLTGKTPNRIEIADLDLDGKPEVILTSQATNSVIVLVNQTSNVTTLSFSATPVTVSLPDWKSTDGLAVEDLDGDFLPEIVTNQFITNTDLYIIKNNSVPGAVTMAPAITLPIGNTVKNLKIGDLDGDGKSDIAFTQLSPTSNLGVFLNTSTSGSLSFGTVKTFLTDTNPWGLDFGDLDGDGKVDIVTPSITKTKLTILNNTSTPGNLSFATVLKDTDFINRHVVISDVDGDGKSDIAFTSIDDNNLNIPASLISIFRNRACMIPKVTPEGPLNICSSLPLTLTSTNGGATTFEWLNATTSTTTAGTNEFSPTVTGDYSVTATSEGGSCKTTSNVVKVAITVTAPIGNPDPQSNGPVCIGNTLNLKVNAPLAGGPYTYEWTGPDNYTGTNINPTPVANFQSKNAGDYFLSTKGPSGCVARLDTLLVAAIDIPEFKVSYTGSSLVCAPGAKTLSVYPAVTVPTDFTIQWYKTTSGLIPGATFSSLSAALTDEYYFTATSTNPGCNVAQSSSAVITVVAPPVADFTLPPSACKGEEVSFTDQSTSDPAASVIYAWNFGDAGTSSDKNPKHIFTTATGFTVKLTVAYTGNACPASVSKPITITAAPDVFITNAENTFDVCPESSLVLGLNATFNSYLWSTGESSPTITVKDPGDYSVDVVATNGCKLKAEQIIGGLPAPTVTATVTPEEIDEGASAQLTAEGLVDYSWTPTETLSDPSIPNPVATPLSSTTYTVTGKGGNGCSGSTTVQLKVKGEAIVNKLLPGNFFSPNGDAVSPFWMVGKIDEYPQCEVTIYDDKGVKVYNSKPYQNNWDGTFNGKQLPDGVYYYIIRCEGEESMPRSGSITLLR